MNINIDMAINNILSNLMRERHVINFTHGTNERLYHVTGKNFYIEATESAKGDKYTMSMSVGHDRTFSLNDFLSQAQVKQYAKRFIETYNALQHPRESDTIAHNIDILRAANCFYLNQQQILNNALRKKTK